MTDSLHLNKKQTKGDLTKARIIEVAQELFFKQGYDATSTAQIAKQVGLSEAALYKHFKGKKSLLLRTVEPIRLPEPEADFYTSLSEKALLNEWTKHILAVVFANRSQYSILFTESQKHPELSEDYVRDIYQQTIGEREILKRTDNGTLPKLDFILLQVGLIGAFLAMLKHKEIHNPELTLVDVPEDIQQLLLLMIEGQVL